MRKIVRFIWRKATLFYLMHAIVFYPLYLYIMSFVGNHYKISSIDSLTLSIKILDNLSGYLATNYPFLYVILTYIIPIPILLILGWSIKYYLLPKNMTALIKSLRERHYLIIELALENLENDVRELHAWVQGLINGRKVNPAECKVYGRKMIERTSAKILYTTCLQTPQEFHDNLKDFSEFIADIIKTNDKKLLRIIVCDPSIFDLNLIPSVEDRDKIKWFVKLHYLHDNFLTLKYIEHGRFKTLFESININSSRLDFMLFDKLVYALETRAEQPYQVTKSISGNYTLYLMDTSEDVSKYEKFKEDLIKHSHEVFSYIVNHGWDKLYS